MWMDGLLNKKELRTLALENLQKISPQRRKEGETNAFTTLLEKLNPFSHILSFASFRDELSLWPLNQHLAQEGKLLLPKVSHPHLIAFQVPSLHDLQLSSFGILEPNGKDPFPLNKIECLLVPGLLFDPQGYRLGYGGGYYDRLLGQIQCPSWGIAFLEQSFTLNSIVEKHDKAVTQVFFF